MFNHFRRSAPQDGLSCPCEAIRLLYVAKIPRPARPGGAHTSDRRHWETAEAPPVAEKARLFRGSGAIGGPNRAGNRNAAAVKPSGGGSRGSLLPFESPQTSLAVFIFTPGPMVDAATQERIYWPLAEAGFAFTMAPIRAL